MKKTKKKNKEEVNFKHNISEYWRFLRNYKFLFFATLIVSFLLQASHAVDKFLFKIIIDKGTAFSDGSLLVGEFTKLLVLIALVFGGIIILKFFLEWFFLHFMNRLSTGLIVDLKRKYFNHILGLSHNFHTTHKTGSLISKLSRGAGAIERLTDVIIYNFVSLIFSLIIVGGSLIYFNLASGIVLFITAGCFVSYSWILLSYQKKYNLIANDAEDREKGNVSDIFTNIDSVKYFGKELRIKKRFERLTEDVRKAFIRAWDFWKWMEGGQALILSIGTFFLVYFPIKSFLAGGASLGTLVFIYTIYGNIFWSLYGFVHGIKNYYRAMADLNGLFEYGKIENEVKDKAGAKNLVIEKGEIEFNNVSFNYGKRKMFEKFNLNIPKNKKIALVGHSGCGKSSLVKLLYRMYDLKSGEILIDGKNINSVKRESLRAEMAIVPQEAILFDDTIFNNIKFANPKASREQVLQAIKFAQLDKIILNFPKKENTIVGERGVKLSGGEKQRVSIARALLANKKVLVLDEATSALDSETEHEIQKDLTKLMEGRTSIIIAHRLSTIMHADVIVVMREGKIIQMGDHRTLITEGGEYQRLWDLQKGGYVE
jgi:ATP-binding cassette, subfamily B, heavy metal transporter